jgi:hypothetical protein
MAASPGPSLLGGRPHRHSVFALQEVIANKARADCIEIINRQNTVKDICMTHDRVTQQGVNTSFFNLPDEAEDLKATNARNAAPSGNGAAAPQKQAAGRQGWWP